MKFYCGGQKVKIESWARELGLVMLYLLTQLICRDGMLGQPLSTRCKTKIESQINTTSIVINIQLEIAEKWLSVRPWV